MDMTGRDDISSGPGFDLLIVDDDDALAALMERALAAFGHRSVIVGNGREALERIATEAFDLIVMDRILPGMDGITLLKRLREAGIIMPVVMLTALGQVTHKVEGLNAGADDYLVKPIDPAELNARLHALHRARRWEGTESDTLRAADLVVSPTKFRAWRAGKALDLANIEFRLLAEFVRNAGAVLTRPVLLERVWGYDFEPATNIVDAYVRRLRMKLTEHGGDDPIVTLRGVGYMLRD